MNSKWNPKQYEKFKLQRSKPFFDLLELIKKEKFANGVDLGCGTGELTLELFNQLQPQTFLGIDSSQEMLDQSVKFKKAGLDFELLNIAQFSPSKNVDLVFSNAALHWVPNHEQLIPAILGWVKPGGQVAIQMPFNFDHPSHQVARDTARTLFPNVFSDGGQVSATLPIERYAEILYNRGFEEQVCRVEVYGHAMPSGTEVIEWTKGTLLTAYQAKLSQEEFERFLSRYQTELLKIIGRGPYFYAFKRLLIWGMKNRNE